MGGVLPYRELWGEHKNIKNKNSIGSLLKYLPSEWNNLKQLLENQLY